MGGECKEGPAYLSAVKGEIPDNGLLTLVNLTPFHFALNTLFQGTDRSKFNMHITSISSTNPRELDANAHQVPAVDDEGSRIVCSRRIEFF